MSKILVKELEDFKSLGKALKLGDSQYEIIVLLEAGPRIMHFSKPGGENILEDQVPLSEPLPDGHTWKLMGGHRVWHSPEAFPRSYLNDCDKLERYELSDDGILLVQKEEPWSQIQKMIDIRFMGSHLRVTNRLVNKGAWEIDMGVWSLTVGSRGGRAVCPVVQRNTGLLPNAHYVSWPYSRLNDKRVYWGQKYIVVENDVADPSAFKFGYPNEYGYAAYFNKGLCFIKKFPYDMGANYPDNGCSWETYSSDWGIELECLSPIRKVKPNSAIEMTDEWYLFDNIKKPAVDEEDIENTLKPIAEYAGIELPVVVSEGWSPLD
jgi:hypothetical protein